MTNLPAPLDELKSALKPAGFAIVKETSEGFTAQITVTLATWALGSRKARRSLSLRFDAASRTGYLRESLMETSMGFAPPVFLAELWKQKGAEKTASLASRGPGGGGEVHFGNLRDELKSIIERAGWRFVYEAAKAP